MAETTSILIYIIIKQNLEPFRQKVILMRKGYGWLLMLVGFSFIDHVRMGARDSMMGTLATVCEPYWAFICVTR